VKLGIDLPYELDWVAEQLRTYMERGLAEIQSGGRPEYAAGYYAAAKDLTESLESAYAELLAARRNVVGIKRDG
jgi:hypothetical protein